jgi:hypothetical protein
MINFGHCTYRSEVLAKLCYLEQFGLIYWIFHMGCYMYVFYKYMQLCLSLGAAGGNRKHQTLLYSTLLTLMNVSVLRSYICYQCLMIAYYSIEPKYVAHFRQ